MDCFRIDESGYTGFDLLNPEQRFQGATTVRDQQRGRRAVDQGTLSPAAGKRTEVPGLVPATGKPSASAGVDARYLGRPTNA